MRPRARDASLSPAIPRAACRAAILQPVFQLTPNCRHASLIVSCRRSRAVMNFFPISGSVWVHGIRPPDPPRSPWSRSSVTHVPGHDCHPCARVGPTAADLVSELEEAHEQHQLGRYLKRIAAWDLVIVDELGYLP
jgi:hypothetical protein